MDVDRSSTSPLPDPQRLNYACESLGAMCGVVCESELCVIE